MPRDPIEEMDPSYPRMPGDYEYRRVDLRTSQGFDEAERLQAAGWKIEQSSPDLLVFSRPSKAGRRRGVGESSPMQSRKDPIEEAMERRSADGEWIKCPECGQTIHLNKWGMAPPHAKYHASDIPCPASRDFIHPFGRKPKEGMSMRHDPIEEAVDHVLCIKRPPMLRVTDKDQETGLDEQEPLTEIQFVRPAWVTVDVDGQRKAATGPRSRSGQMTIRVKARDRGGVADCLEIDVIGSEDGSSALIRVSGPDGQELWSNTYEQ